MWGKLSVYFKTNWKTTIGGILVLIIGILTGAGIISTEVGSALIGLAAFFGFTAAKDANKTGTGGK